MTENPAEPTSPSPDASPRRRRWRRIVWIAAAVIVVLLLALPTILSLGIARSQAQRIASDALGTEVTLGSLGFGWTGRIDLTALSIAQPAGFDAAEPLLELDRVDADVALASLLSGSVGLSGTVRGARLVVIQNAAGSTNLQALGKRSDGEPAPEPVPEPEPPAGGSGGGSLDNVRLNLELVDAEIRIRHAERGELETLSNVRAKLSKAFGGDQLQLTFDAELAHGEAASDRGHIRVEAGVEARADAPIDVRLDVAGVDLARYRPLVDGVFGAGALDHLAGQVAADVRVTGVPSDRLTAAGRIEVESPDLGGTLTKGLRLTAPRWSLQTDVSGTVPSGTGPIDADLSGLAVDLGFFRLAGEKTDAGRAAFTFGVDVAALAGEDGPVPAMLAGTGTRLDGRIGLPLTTELGSMQLGDLIGALFVDATLTVDRLEYAEQALTGLGLDLDLDGGTARIGASTGRLAGGALTFAVEADAAALRDGKVSVDLGVEGAKLAGAAVEALRYAVPLFAGLDAERAVAARFEALGDARLSAAGTLAPAEGQGVLEWLGGFTGNGSVALREGGFVPAPGVASLTGLLAQMAPKAVAGGGGGGSRLLFDSIGTSFELGGGVVRSDTSDLSVGGAKLALVGTTSLGGALDHTLDLRGLLRGHRDGELVLRYLGDQPLGARIAGTLTAPKLALPDLQDLIKQALTKAVETEGQNALRDLLEKATGKKKDGESDPIDEALQRGAEDLLRGVLGGDPKKKEGEGDGGGGKEQQSPADPLQQLLRGILPGGKPKKDPDRDRDAGRG